MRFSTVLFLTVTISLALVDQVLPLACRPEAVDIDEILPSIKATIDWDSLTVSGFSSGAIMAAQYVVAHSSEVKGAGVLAGVTYGQYYNNSNIPQGGLRFITGAFPFTPLPFLDAVLNPVNLPILQYASVPELEAQALAFAANGQIDTLDNLNGTKVFVYSGSNDHIVNNDHGHRVAQFFDDFNANVATDLNHFADHVMGTDYFPTPLTLTCSLAPNFISLATDLTTVGTSWYSTCSATCTEPVITVRLQVRPLSLVPFMPLTSPH